METEEHADQPTSLTFQEVVPHAGLLAGVKAVYGRVTVRALCFSRHGHPQGSDASFSLPRGVAKQFDTRPFVITIGGGKKVVDGLRSRVTNVVRLTGAYGETN